MVRNSNGELYTHEALLHSTVVKALGLDIIGSLFEIQWKQCLVVTKFLTYFFYNRPGNIAIFVSLFGVTVR